MSSFFFPRPSKAELSLLFLSFCLCWTPTVSPPTLQMLVSRPRRAEVLQMFDLQARRAAVKSAASSALKPVADWPCIELQRGSWEPFHRREGGMEEDVVIDSWVKERLVNVDGVSRRKEERNTDAMSSSEAAEEKDLCKDMKRTFANCWTEEIAVQHRFRYWKGL